MATPNWSSGVVFPQQNDASKDSTRKVSRLAKTCRANDFDCDDEKMTDQMRDTFAKNPTWCNARWALQHMRQNSAKGFAPSIIVRSWLQRALFNLGCFTQSYPWPVLLIGTAVLALWAIGLKDVHIETDIEKLWVEKGGRLEREQRFIANARAYSSPIYANTSSFNSKGNQGNDSDEASGGPDSLSMAFQVLIQTPLAGHGRSILTREDLLLHTELMLNISQMKIQMFDTEWTLNDICFKSEPPKVGGELGGLLDNMLGQIIPCVIVTPLDCFWEGSKPLGPFPPLAVPPGINEFLTGALPNEITWMNLYPNQTLSVLNDLGISDFFPGIADLFNQTGMWDAYQKKPCLNPWDPLCPETSPNKQSNIPLDFASIMNGSCKSFASKIMQWPEALILGGLKKANNNLENAEAIQTVMFTASGNDVYKRIKGNPNGKLSLSGGKWNDSHANWSIDAANAVLFAWQHNFTEEKPTASNSSRRSARKAKDKTTIPSASNSTNHTTNAIVVPSEHTDIGKLLRRKITSKPIFHPLSPSAINDMLQEFSKFNFNEIIAGFFIMLVYVAITLVRLKSSGIYSAVGLAIMGVKLVVFAEVAGLGFSTAIGVQFNAATTQIVPFLTLGLGIDDMILLACHYVDITKICKHNEIGHLLKETGLTVLLTAVSNIVSFFVGTIVPVPALQAFCLQVAILLIFNIIALLTIYPAAMAIDLQRRAARRVDVLCCIKVRKNKVLPNEKSSHAISSKDNANVSNGNSTTLQLQKKSFDYKKLSLYHFVNYYYVPFLLKWPVKIAVLILFGLLLVAGAILSTRIEMGLGVTDIVPKDTSPYDFLKTRDTYFSFYPGNIVLEGDIDYPRNQALIHALRNEIRDIKYVVKDGTLGNYYWLQLMRDWLIRIQTAFDEDWHAGKITPRGPECDGSDFKARDDAVIAYKLLLNQNNSFDKALAEQTSLIYDGIINVDVFWYAVTAWVKADTISYYFAQANFAPFPWPRWQYEKGHCSPNMTVDNLRIPPAEPLRMSLMPMFMNNLKDTPTTVDLIEQVRNVCEVYSALGVRSFPEGIPFTFWEQYITLRHYLIIALVICVAAVFAVITIVLMSPWISAVIILVIVMIIVELAGFLGAIGLKMNAVSAVTLISAVGVSVEFTVQISFRYLTSLGTPNQRIVSTMKHMFNPVYHGDVATFLGILMLGLSSFEFIVKYFFAVMSFLIVLGILNGVALLPVLLTLIGPFPEVRPKDNSHYLPPPIGASTNGKQSNGDGKSSAYRPSSNHTSDGSSKIPGHQTVEGKYEDIDLGDDYPKHKNHSNNV